MATFDALSAKVPVPSIPFVGPDGMVSREWLYFLIALFNRTGGAQGTSSTTIETDIAVLQKQVTALFIEEAMSTTARAPLTTDPFLAAILASPSPQAVSQTLTANTGSAINNGAIQSDRQGTIAGGGHITYTPTSGVSNILINGGTVATTIDIAAPNYAGQHLRAQYKNGATAEALNLGTTVVLGSMITGYTSTATAGVSDFLQLIGANGSQWALVAIAQGYTI